MERASMPARCEIISLRRIFPQRRRLNVKPSSLKLNGKLYTVAKAQFGKGCAAVAKGSAGSVSQLRAPTYENSAVATSIKNPSPLAAAIPAVLAVGHASPLAFAP